MPHASQSEADSLPPKTSNEGNNDVITPELSNTLSNLVILPPLQKEGTLERDELLDAVPLPPLRPEEPVSSIRAALSEVCGYAHYTNYRLVLEKPPPESSSVKPTGTHKPPIVSPYTGQNAVVSIPTAVKSLDREPQTPQSDKGDAFVLDDYGDLSPLLEKGLESGSAFRVVLERYDAASVRDHVIRLRSLLEGNAPSTTTLDEGVADATAGTHASRGDDKETDGDSPALVNGGVEPDPKLGSAGGSTNSNAGDAKSESQPDSPTERKRQESGSQAESTSNPNQDLRQKVSNLPKYGPDEPITVNGKNLKDFFYLTCGEDPSLYFDDGPKADNLSGKKENGSKSKKKNKKLKEKSKGEEEENKEEVLDEEVMRDVIPRLNRLEERTRVKCSIRMSGFHPPPQFRRLMGDLAYLEVVPPGEKQVIHVTAVPTGFFVNRSWTKEGSHHFDPSPGPDPCFSHELLDCLLQCSKSFQNAWEDALDASKERLSLMAVLNKDGPFSSLFRVAIRGDFAGYSNPTTSSATEGIDALLQSPSWIVPISHAEKQSEDSWNRNAVHSYNLSRTEDELSNSFGVDIRSGAVRDWNEELQTAREMPITTQLERIERARVMNKVLVDFGEASVHGVKAIFDGQIAPMNPNEATRSQVYLHNNIFFSRAVDAGVETFKIAKGDKAARKSASRDVLCLGALHRMERSGLHTLATVLVDYLGTRFVCQSILPGILSGEKTHTLLYGAVEAGSPLMWDKEMHELLENTLGKALMIATRPLPREPLTDKRAAEIQEFKSSSPLYLDKREEEKKEDEDAPASIAVCAPIEAKGIRGSDQRKYVLDMTRLTPRDANWVSESNGGTGSWESLLKSNGSTKVNHNIPDCVDDDEWTLAVLRPELVTNYTQVSMAKYLKEKTAKDSDDKEAKGETGESENTPTDGSEPKSDASSDTPDEPKGADVEANKANEGEKETKKSKNTLSEEDLNYLKSLRFNVNVFLPDIKSLEGIDDEAAIQVRKDEDMARKAAKFLWDEVIPRVTAEVRDCTGHQIPQDGRGLTEYMHQHGINCRYLGRLAMLAQQEEEMDRKNIEALQQGKPSKFSRRVMPRSWLELLECEMVARAAKHVLDSYLSENGGAGATIPSQIVASFLCALVSESEETASQTEIRMGKESGPDDDDFNSLTICDTGGSGDAVALPVRRRSEVWNDIEKEVGRRFRYSLTLYNAGGKSGRTLYIPLLRRICLRTGVRLAAKTYEVGGKCLCSGGNTSGGRMTASYPISPLDIVDIVPLMKHSAAHGEGFVPCGFGGTVGHPSLHISLQDARATLEAAHLHHNARALSQALDLAQEACSLYQRVTETPAHPGVVRCLDLMASILFDAGEPALAAANAVKSLGLLVQVGGFDSPDAISAHLVLFQMLMTAGQPSSAVKHLRAAIYLMEVLGGPHNMEIANAYHKLGTAYHGAHELGTALRFYQESGSRESCDRLLEGMIAKSTATVLAGIGEFKLAVDNEKRAFHLFSTLLGEGHSLTNSSDQALKKFMVMAVEHGSKMVEDRKKRQEEEAANAIASEIEAEEAAEEEKRKKKAKKKKGKK